MAFLYDNLIATVVSMTVLLVLVSIQMRATHTSVSQSARHATLSQAKSLVTWLEEDLEAMGRNMDDGEIIFEDPSSSPSRYTNDASPTGAVLGGLTYYYREEDGGSETKIEYALSEADSLMVNGEERVVYQLERKENGVTDGGSSAMLGYFDLRFVGRNAGQVTNPADNQEKIRGIRVHFSVVPPYQNRETTLNEVHRKVVVPYTPAHE